MVVAGRCIDDGSAAFNRSDANYSLIERAVVPLRSARRRWRFGPTRKLTTRATPTIDDRNFYKLEKWTKDGSKVDRLLYAGNNLDKARLLFQAAIKHRPRIRLTIRQRMRVVRQWPPLETPDNVK